MIVFAVATDKTILVKEFEQSLIKYNYNYEILGLGMTWSGFDLKMKLYYNALKKLPKDEIVIVCDSYDVMFVQSSKKIQERYNKLASNKVVIGLEPECYESICDKETTKVCNIDNKKHKYYKYINSGFIMGRADLLMDIFKFQLDTNQHDDQIGLGKWVKNNCNLCYFDYDFQFVFNYLDTSVNFKRLKIKITNDTMKIDKNITVDGINPCVIHMPGQSNDLGKRSEIIRTFVLPERKKLGTMYYLNLNFLRLCKKDRYYCGYWIVPVCLILLILFVLFIMSCKSEDKYKNILYIVGIRK